jgi:hypothetical protein
MGDGSFARQALEAFTNSELCLIQMAPEPTVTIPLTTNIDDIEDNLIVPAIDRRHCCSACTSAPRG